MQTWWEEKGLPDPKPFWTQYWRGLYEVPRAWAHKGQNLVHAFEVLIDQESSFHFDVRSQAMMMAGMACEVMLKAALVNNPEMLRIVTTPVKQLSKEDREMRKKFYSHDLLTLFGMTKVDLSENEVLIADSLSEYIQWRGRYVIPRETDIDDLIPIKRANGMIGGKSLDRASARAMIDKVVEVVKRELYRDDG